MRGTDEFSGANMRLARIATIAIANERATGLY